ncbi:unnamed protein product [Cylicocyclus nassatus]|uniref:Uncharacterized protein n=1 Tax=Cylicocyclus nassatus TaxID=53992 RepID=A0AA36H7Z7_CYLNA|nr:unnamed protein product [Cylicocyclus nassatus]
MQKQIATQREAINQNTADKDEPNVLVRKERLINLLNEQQPPRAKAVSEEQQKAYKGLADKIKDLEKQLAARADACNTPSAPNAPTTSSAPIKRARASSSSSTSSSDSDVAIVEEKKKEVDASKGAEVAKKKKKE